MVPPIGSVVAVGFHQSEAEIDTQNDYDLFCLGLNTHLFLGLLRLSNATDWQIKRKREANYPHVITDTRFRLSGGVEQRHPAFTNALVEAARTLPDGRLTLNGTYEGIKSKFEYWYPGGDSIATWRYESAPALASSKVGIQIPRETLTEGQYKFMALLCRGFKAELDQKRALRLNWESQQLRPLTEQQAKWIGHSAADFQRGTRYFTDAKSL